MTNDPLTSRADTFFRTSTPIHVVSDFASAEFASAVSRRVRMGELTRSEAVAAFSNLDAWIYLSAERIVTTPAEIASVQAMLRRLDLPLRTPDALNIALCLRAGVPLATFEKKMKTCAVALSVTLAPV